MSASDVLPSDAQGLAVVVLLYTVLNAVCAGLVVLMHVRHGDRLGYVPICAVFMIINIVAAFIQQIHFFTSFTSIQTAAYDYQVRGVYTGKPAFTGTHTSLDTVLYEIQLYCYNVESLLFLLWIASLWRHVWRLRVGVLDKGGHVVSTSAKIASILIPAILIGIANASAIDDAPGISLILCNILLAGSVAIGLVFLVLVFYKYVRIQKYLSDSSSGNKGLFARFKWRLRFSMPSNLKSKSQRSRTAESQMQSGAFDQSRDHTMEAGSQMPGEYARSAPRKDVSKIYDKWLMIRFSICFVLLCIMQIFLIYYSIARYLSSDTSAETAKLDLSAGGAIISLVMFIPGVTLGLLIFIVFGTTGPFRRDYARWANSIFCCATRRKSSGGSLHRSESVVRLTNLGPTRSKGESMEAEHGQAVHGGKSSGPEGEYQTSVQPIQDTYNHVHNYDSK